MHQEAPSHLNEGSKMKLTLSKETLRKLAVKSSVKAGYLVHTIECGPVQQLPDGVGPTFSQPAKCIGQGLNKAGNPADVGHVLGAGSNP